MPQSLIDVGQKEEGANSSELYSIWKLLMPIAKEEKRQVA